MTENINKTYTISLPLIEPDDMDIIGLKGEMTYIANKSDITIPPGFILTTEAFDDFLVANDIKDHVYAKIKSLDPNNYEEIKKTSSELKDMIKKGVIPTSVREAIYAAYSYIPGAHGKIVSVRPSLSQDLNYNRTAVENEYSYVYIINEEELEAVILMAWQVILDPHIIQHRLQITYTGPINTALLIMKMQNAEVSGQAYGWDIHNKKNDYIHIQSILGLWKSTEIETEHPDLYLVRKEHEIIEKKNTSGQEKMMIFTGNTEDPENLIRQVDVSNNWKMRQKIMDETIQDIAIILKTLEENIGTNVSIEWGINMGEIIINNISLPQEKLILMDDEDNQEESEPTKTATNDEEIEDYIEEIENTINMKDEEINHDATNLAEGVKKDQKKILSNNNVSNTKNNSRNVLTPKHEKLWNSIKFEEGLEEDMTVTKLWIDINQTFPKRKMNSNLFDGIFSLRGEDIVEGYGYNLKNLSAKQLQSFQDYIETQVESVISQDKENYSIYSLSVLNIDQADKYLSSTKSGMKMHLANNRILDREILSVKNLRNKKGYRNLWIGIRDIDQIDDLKSIRKIIYTHGLRSTATFKVIAEVNKIPLFLSIANYLDDSVDGIVLYLDEILYNLFGKKVKSSEIMKNDTFWGVFEKIMKEIIKYKLELIIKSDILKNNTDLLDKFITSGITGVCVYASIIEPIREKVQKIERRMFEKN